MTSPGPQLVCPDCGGPIVRIIVGDVWICANLCPASRRSDVPPRPEKPTWREEVYR